MKRVLFLLIVIIISKFAFSQKIIETKVDDFTGTKSISTSSVSFNFTTACNIIKVDDNFILSIASRVSDLYEVEEFGELLFKLKDGTIVTLYSCSYQCADYTNYWLNDVFVEYYELTPFYNITNNDLSLLQTNNVVKVRIVLKTGLIDFEIKPRIANKLRTMFNLFPLTTNNQ